MSQAALDRIRALYFGASKATIARDFAEAIDLLKSMASEEERERATVFMEGLAELRGQWTSRPAPTSSGRRSGAARARSDRSTRGGRRPR